MHRSFAPDGYLKYYMLLDILKKAHTQYNESKKLIPVYQAALAHWKDVQREWQNVRLKRPDLPRVDYSMFISTAKIKQLKKELNYLTGQCKEAKHIFHMARDNFMDFLEFKRACEEK